MSREWLGPTVFSLMAKEESSEIPLPLSRVPSENELPLSGVATRFHHVSVPRVRGLLPGMVETVPSPILVVDQDGRVVVANAASRSILGFDQAGLVGYSIARCLNEKLIEAARIRVLAQGGPYRYRDKIRLADTERELEVSADLLSLPEGEFLCLSLLDRTDSDRERAEWLSRSPDWVPSVHLDRVHHLEALGHLTGTFAHDFNNLLAVILGSLEAAERRLKKKEPPFEDIQRALTATERSIQAASQILHYVRGRGGKAEDLCPDEIIVELRGLMERALGEDVRLEVELHPTASVRASASQLETALLNLVINARDAIGEAGTISIELMQAAMSKVEASEINLPPGDYVCIAVSDSGCGMSEETKNHAFEPFFTTKPEGLGTGLGLSSVCGIMRGLGGSARISSTIGQGTRVELFFPASPPSDPALRL